ncbi:MAG TPA: polyprenyl synthetase family protein [Candidatus Baltobacteraceae bacterium]
MIQTNATDIEPSLLSEHRSLMSEYMSSTALPLGSFAGRMAAYHMGWVDTHAQPQASSSGKFVRPSLCLWACVACGGDVESALPAAAALEWIHNFTLIHDDIQDGDRQRRGRQTVWSVWGMPQGINAGDALFALAFTNLAAQSHVPDRTLRVVRALSEATLEVIEGQCLDLQFEGRIDTTLGDYLRMVRGKTGALLGASLEAGALASGAAEDLSRAFRYAGRLLGTAFQMRDDWLGIWGDPSLTGKSRSADAKRRKMTYPTIVAYDAMSPSQRGRMRALFGEQATERDSEIRELLEEMGGSELTREAPARFARKAVNAVARTGLSKESVEKFDAMAHYVATRRR